MKQPHFEHLEERLDRVRDGCSFISDSESTYLGRPEETHFRQPIGLLPRGVIGLPTVFVAHEFIGLQANVTEEAARLAVRDRLSGAASRGDLLPVA